MITDEGLGTNELTLTGPDAELFEINGDQLSLRANAILNPEDNPVLDVTINVDDTTVGRAIARSSAVKTGVDPIQHGVIPSGSHTFAANVVFDSSVTLQNIQSHTPKSG